VLISQVAKEEGLFNINDVLKTAIDEIGRMEFFSEKFKEKVYEVIRSNKPLIAVVHRNYESRFKIFGKMITVTKDNREKLPHLILNLISV
jgi:nucleoside-triphosphatase